MYKHLTLEQRYTIDVLLQQKKSRKEICETIKISQSTLSRELKRNSGQRGYHCKQAQVKADAEHLFADAKNKYFLNQLIHSCLWGLGVTVS